jgi:MOSC domain-containing protein YiiM
LRLISLQVGKPETVTYQGKELLTGINKSRVSAPLLLSAANFEGDAQADLVHHGGPDKAVNAYCIEHYPYWQRELNRQLPNGAFGENMTLQNMTEDTVCIGDIYRIGEAVVQVSQPRQPCFKLGMKHGAPDLPHKVMQTGYTGYYFRVLEPGVVPPQADVRLEERHPAGITIAFANRIKYDDKYNRAALERLVGLPELADAWKHSFRKRLAELDTAQSNEERGCGACRSS